jgi:hypothetical protein
VTAARILARACDQLDAGHGDRRGWAQLIRPATGGGSSERAGIIVIELLEAHVRVTIDPGTDRETRFVSGVDSRGASCPGAS